MALGDGHRHSGLRAGPDAEGRRRVELITGEERRRKWTREQKAHITEESLEADVNVSEVARRYGVSVGLLHYWRKAARQAAIQTAVPSPMAFVPLIVGSPNAASDDHAPIRSSGLPGSSIEIECGDVLIRVNGVVDGEALRAVMAAVRGR